MKWLYPVLTAVYLFAIPSMGFGQEAQAEMIPPPVQSSFEVIEIERHQFSVQRVRGRVYVNGVESADDVVENQSQEIRLVEVFDGLDFANTREFRSWAKTLRGKRTYTYDNVSLRHSDGSVVTTPLVLLPPAHRVIADVAWNRWLEQQRAAEAEEQRIAAAQQAEQNRIAALEDLLRQQAVHAGQVANQIANLEQRLARQTRRQAYIARRQTFFVPQVAIASTGTEFNVGFSNFGFAFSEVR